jgi:hypothetical protein
MKHGEISRWANTVCGWLAGWLAYEPRLEKNMPYDSVIYPRVAEQVQHAQEQSAQPACLHCTGITSHTDVMFVRLRYMLKHFPLSARIVPDRLARLLLTKPPLTIHIARLPIKHFGYAINRLRTLGWARLRSACMPLHALLMSRTVSSLQSASWL